MWFLARLTFGAKIGFEVKILAAPLFFLPTLPFSPHLFTLYIPAGAKVTEHLLGYRGGLDPLWIQEGLDLLGHMGCVWLCVCVCVCGWGLLFIQSLNLVGYREGLDLLTTAPPQSTLAACTNCSWYDAVVYKCFILYILDIYQLWIKNHGENIKDVVVDSGWVFIFRLSISEI